MPRLCLGGCLPQTPRLIVRGSRPPDPQVWGLPAGAPQDKAGRLGGNSPQDLRHGLSALVLRGLDVNWLSSYRLRIAQSSVLQIAFDVFETVGLGATPAARLNELSSLIKALARVVYSNLKTTRWVIPSTNKTSLVRWTPSPTPPIPWGVCFLLCSGFRVRSFS